ncbi:neuropilin-1-like [Amphiura filiformis]|uniref:neuropilin-1-like n=1 Tax=Amphiura filiformis TaxID=82378 RepID=UPI003B21DFE6
MENGEIPDANIQATSVYGSNRATNGRLNHHWGFWCSVPGQSGTIWIQADIGYQTYVSGVITQGGGQRNPYWVTSFTVSTFMTAGADEVFVADRNGNAIIFPGNVEKDAKLTTTFSEPVHARIVRINCLSKANHYYALRFEILGCKIDRYMTQRDRMRRMPSVNVN